MFCYQPDLFSQTQLVNSELFTRLTMSDLVIKNIARIRELKQEAADADVLIAANPEDCDMNRELAEKKKQLLQEADKLKRQLPAFIFQATFDETLSKKGYKGAWRKQSAARLNGLYMLDIDHVDEPKALFDKWVDDFKNDDADFMQAETWVAKNAFCNRLGILLVHVTSSGKGLRLVAKANENRGNIADNQAWLAKELGVKMDESCKDASRLSFCPSYEDIIFINKEELFNYENKAFDEKYGAQYRGGSSRPTGATRSNRAASGSRSDKQAQAAAGAGPRSNEGSAADDDGLGKRIKEGYHGKSYAEIIANWLEDVCGGTPQAGDRHASLYQMACDLRYITDFDPKLLARVLRECEVGRAIEAERGADEIERIASDACALQRYRTMPKRLRTLLEAIGIQLDGQGRDASAAQAPEIDYDYWAQRLDPLLRDSPGYREAVVTLPPAHKLGGVLAAGAMLGTYLTRTWWEHFDGKVYRLSYLVYIIGGAASGKSFIVEMDKLLMAPMLASDRVGREWERQYKEEMKKRAASSKNAKAEAPEQQHPVIRYLPSTISNAMLYRRLTDAVDKDTLGPDDQPMHLHCYTCEAELATALRAQQGSWAGKLDLETKSFQNETAGVDYANDQSTNGIIQINWNQVISGTPDAMARKIRPATVLDGLATRLCVFPMPSNDYAMIERRRAIHDHEREAYLRSIGLKLEAIKGELKCDRLVDFCYDYEVRLTKEAEAEQDLCLDYFRKRIPLIMMRYALVRAVMRQVDDLIAGKPLEIIDSDLDFACLIGDFCLMSQMHMFGQMVMDALEAESKNFVPRRRMQKTREVFKRLPEKFTYQDLLAAGLFDSYTQARASCSRWTQEGFLKKKDRKYFVKVIKELPE